LVNDRNGADWIAYVLRPTLDSKGQYVYASDQHLPVSSPSRPPEVWVISPQEELLHPNTISSLSDFATGLDHLSTNLNRFARIRQLLSLDNPNKKTPLKVAVTVLRPNPQCRSQCQYLPDDPDHKRLESLGSYNLATVAQDLRAAKNTALRQQDLVTFQVKNQDRSSWYAYVFDVGPDGTIVRVLPVNYSNEDAALLTGGAGWDLGTDQVVRFTEKGIETIKIIVSQRPIDPRLIDQPIGFTKGSLNPLEHLLQSATLGRRAVENHDPGDWVSTAASLEVAAAVASH
jgi:hypothetical protein